MSTSANTLEVYKVSKSFGGNMVVRDISFSVGAGEILGMVGPNGAGKTTTIRMAMDIIKPDRGEINVLGQSINEDAKDRIGYLPEERGLYRKLTVSEALSYLASLKNVETRIIEARTKDLLERVDMLPHKGKKIEELSRGMGQLIQFIVTILHDPDLVILDEPFAGLDPVNTNLIKELILELRSRGKSIILSTHMMNQVEELCDRILMIDNGCAVLYGGLAEIKRRFRNNSIFVECEGSLDGIDGVTGSKNHGKYVELFLDGHTSPQDVLSRMVSRNMEISRFEVSTPALNEIFIQVVQGKQ